MRRCWQSKRGLQCAVVGGQSCRGVGYHWLREWAGLWKKVRLG